MPKAPMTRRRYLGLTAAVAATALPVLADEQKETQESSVAKKTFLNQKRPVITSLYSEETPEKAIEKARKSASEGAGGIAFELHLLKPEFRNHDSLKRIIDSVPLPFMFCFYRKDKWEQRGDDARQELLLTAAEAGASMIDVMGDLYDPSPLELTRSPAAVEKQMRLIDSIHAKNAAVVMSSHTGRFLTTEQVIEHMKTMEARGADVVKLVQAANTEQELEEAIRTTFALRRELKVPFIHLCGGKFSRPHRFFGPVLGLAIFFAVQGNSTTSLQPNIAAIKSVLEHINWDIDAI